MISSKLIFKKSSFGSYKVPILSGDLNLDVIYILFDDGSNLSGLTKKLLDKNFSGTAGNRYRIDLIDENNLRIGDQFDEEEEFYVNFPKKTLLKLLDQWRDLVAKNTQEIVFYRNGDEYGLVDAQDFHEA